MTNLDFASFCNRYAGRPGWVVGRGPTLYQYRDLAAVDGPVFFINDSVSQETMLAAKCDSFFFAHDASMAVWLGRIRSTAILVIDHPDAFPPGKGLIRGPYDPLLQREGKVVLYRRFGEFEQAFLLERSRSELARSKQLCIKTGTIHSLLHFAWYLGCSKLYLIGCDGLPNVGYDGRLPNLSDSKSDRAPIIRLDQDEMLRLLKVPVEYLGTPPHRVYLESRMVVRDNRQSEINEFLGEVMRSTHMIGGSLHANLDRTDDSNKIIYLKIQSDNVRELLDLVEKCDAIRKFEKLTIQGAFAEEPPILLRTELG